MTTTDRIPPLLRDICAHIAAHADGVSIDDRIAAAATLVQRLTGITPDRVGVQAAACSRSAAYCLGGAMIPHTSGEIEQFQEQAGHGLRLLGPDPPHTILRVGDMILELADSREWNDRGVYLRPFTAQVASSPTEPWVVEGPRFGVQVSYELVDVAPICAPSSITAYRIADLISRELRLALDADVDDPAADRIAR